MKEIQKWSDIPKFTSEEDESIFWNEHELNVRLMTASQHESDVKESTTITLRFDPRMLTRIKRIARMRYLNYQSMIKQWLAERMEEEIRKQ
jgi:predicted DNA binding CopG/RHH family protein